MIIVKGAAATTSPVVNVPGHAPEPETRLTATWTSWSGDQWTITDYRSPVWALQGATGIDAVVDPEHRWDDFPSLDGSAWSGAKIPRGSIFMPMRVQGGSYQEFMDSLRAFTRSLDPKQRSVLRIVQPDGQWREIACRYESGFGATIEQDPIAVRRATYGITWATEDPFWSGEPVAVTFDYADPAPLFPGPPFAINPARSLANARVTNPGDVESYAVWRVNGPFTSFTVGVGGAVVSMAVTKTAGRWVEIDARPGQLTMLDESGVDVWTSATSENLTGMAIPSGAAVGLTTSLLGAGPASSVQLSFTPRFRRAW